MKKRVSGGLQPPFFHAPKHEIPLLGNAKNGGKTNCKKCLLVKASHQTVAGGSLKSPQCGDFSG